MYTAGGIELDTAMSFLFPSAVFTSNMSLVIAQKLTNTWSPIMIDNIELKRFKHNRLLTGTAEPKMSSVLISMRDLGRSLKKMTDQGKSHHLEPKKTRPHKYARWKQKCIVTRTSYNRFMTWQKRLHILRQLHVSHAHIYITCILHVSHTMH